MKKNAFILACIILLSTATIDAQTIKSAVKKRPFNTASTASVSPNAMGLVRIYNRWKKDGKTTYGINIEGSRVNATGIKPNWWSAQWTFEPVNPGQNLYRIKNRWKKDGRTDYYLHVERGRIEAGGIKPGWHSAMWRLVPVGKTGFYRIQNFWKQDQYLHIEGSRLEAGPMKPNWWSAQWRLSKN
ncbi:MAG: hypothetical protein AAF206_25715 [Bacteroidota bacterium]